jgi:glutamine amidotransferase
VSLTIVDYGVGNLGSIPNMLRRLGARANISADPDDVRRSDRIILPGVGAFDAGMEGIRRSGLAEALSERVLSDGVPTLGLCLGMQLLFEESEEGSSAGLGWLKGRCIRLRAPSPEVALKVPHMGWNTIEIVRDDPIVDGLDPEPRFYFAHSYSVSPSDVADVVAYTTYGLRFPSIVSRGNIRAAQFHPE